MWCPCEQGEGATKVVYGSSNNGTTIAFDEVFHGYAQKLAAKLMLAERTYKPIGLSEETRKKIEDDKALRGAGPPLAPPVVGQEEACSIVGPVEGKVRAGSRFSAASCHCVVV